MMIANPTFEQLRTISSMRQIRAVITVDGHTAIGCANRYTHSDLRNELVAPHAARSETMPPTTSELLIFRTNDLMVVAPFSKRDHSSAEQHLLADLASACEVSLA